MYDFRLWMDLGSQNRFDLFISEKYLKNDDFNLIFTRLDVTLKI